MDDADLVRTRSALLVFSGFLGKAGNSAILDYGEVYEPGRNIAGIKVFLYHLQFSV